MQIKVVGCEDKKFIPFIHRATQHFADNLLSKQLQKHTSIVIKFNNLLTDYGFANIRGYNLKKKPRKFLIVLNPNIGTKQILATLAHEMVHVRQFAYGHLNTTMDKWYDFEIDPEVIDYYFHPWEIEAHGLETGLLTKFATDEQLWTIFKGFHNPANKMRKSKIIWKKN